MCCGMPPKPKVGNTLSASYGSRIEPTYPIAPSYSLAGPMKCSEFGEVGWPFEPVKSIATDIESYQPDLRYWTKLGRSFNSKVVKVI
jgi:hypothetical protein